MVQVYKGLSTNVKRLEKRLLRLTAKALTDFYMLEDGDVVMVCLSGGKDSYTLLRMLMILQTRAPINFEIIAMNLDQKQPGFPEEVLPSYLKAVGVPYQIIEQDTYSIVQDKIPAGKTTCSLCSRLRRGIIYRTAKELGATKIALGHHRNDLVETVFINMFFGGALKSMSPKLLTDDGEHIVIRPLVNCAEQDIARYARAMEFPIIPCNLCGSQTNLQRQKVKQMLAEWEKEYPGRTELIFRALGNVKKSHLVDKELFDFKSINQESRDLAEDLLFDEAQGMSGAQTTFAGEDNDPIIESSLVNIKIS